MSTIDWNNIISDGKKLICFGCDLRCSEGGHEGEASYLQAERDEAA